MRNSVLRPETWLQDNDYVYIPSEDVGEPRLDDGPTTIYAYDAANDEVEWEVNIDYPFGKLDQNEDSLFVFNPPGYIYRISKQTGEIMWSLDVDYFDRGINSRIQGNAMFAQVGILDTQHDYLIDIDQGEILREYRTGDNYWEGSEGLRLDYTLNSKWIMRSQQGVWKFDPKSFETTELTSDVDHRGYYPYISEDTLLYQAKSGLMFLDADTGETRTHEYEMDSRGLQVNIFDSSDHGFVAELYHPEDGESQPYPRRTGNVIRPESWRILLFDSNGERVHEMEVDESKETSAEAVADGFVTTIYSPSENSTSVTYYSQGTATWNRELESKATVSGEFVTGELNFSTFDPDSQSRFDHVIDPLDGSKIWSGQRNDIERDRYIVNSQLGRNIDYLEEDLEDSRTLYGLLIHQSNDHIQVIAPWAPDTVTEFDYPGQGQPDSTIQCEDEIRIPLEGDNMFIIFNGDSFELRSGDSVGPCDYTDTGMARIEDYAAWVAPGGFAAGRNSKDVMADLPIPDHEPHEHARLSQSGFFHFEDGEMYVASEHDLGHSYLGELRLMSFEEPLIEINHDDVYTETEDMEIGVVIDGSEGVLYTIDYRLVLEGDGEMHRINDYEYSRTSESIARLVFGLGDDYDSPQVEPGEYTLRVDVTYGPDDNRRSIEERTKFTIEGDAPGTKTESETNSPESETGFQVPGFVWLTGLAGLAGTAYAILSASRDSNDGDR